MLGMPTISKPVYTPTSYMPESRSFEIPRPPPARPVSWAVPNLRKIEEANEDVDLRRKVSWLSDSLRHHIIAAIGEVSGTFLFLAFAFAIAQIANTKTEVLAPGVTKPDLQQLLYISLGFATSLTVNVWIFFRVSGSAFNPAVIIGLCLIGAVPWTRAIVVIPMQLIGATLAAFVIGVLLPGDITYATSISNNATILQALFIEALTTFILLYTIMMLAVEKHRATFSAPLGIGMALFIGHMIAVNYTGAGINPARALGPALVTLTFPTYHWIYWLGPAIGASLAAILYKILKFLSYETCNAGQDDDGLGVYRVVSRRSPDRGDIWRQQSPDGNDYKGWIRESGIGKSGGAYHRRVESSAGESVSSEHSCVWCDELVLPLKREGTI